MSEPYAECEFCPEKCKFRLDAQSVFQKDPTFFDDVLKIISMGDQDRFIDACIEKSQEYLKNPKTEDVIGLSYCLVVQTLQELDLPQDLKQKIARTVRLKLGRKELGLKKGVSPGKAKESAMRETRAEVAASAAITPEVQPPISRKELTFPAEKTPASRIFNWIKGDKKLAKEIREIRSIDATHLKVIFIPSEGNVLREIDIGVEIIERGFDSCGLIECVATIDVPIDSNLAIGPGQKGFVAVTLAGKGSNENEVLEQLKGVNLRDASKWDKYMVAFNNEKVLLKAIASLTLECPIVGGHDPVRVPVFIMHEGTRAGIGLKTFIHLKTPPSLILSNILGVIASDLVSIHQPGAPAAGAGVRVPPAAIPAAPKTPVERIMTWIRGDAKFMKDVVELRPLGKDRFKIVFNPKSEGFLRDIEVGFDLIERDLEVCALLDCTAAVDVTYDYNFALGPGRKGPIAASLTSMTPDDNSAVEDLKKVNLKEPGTWDRLMVTFNNDKDLLRAVGNLILECPIPEARPAIRVPVYLVREGKFTIIRLKTYITGKSASEAATAVFINIMEAIASDMDYLRDYTAQERARNVTSSQEFYAVKGPAVPTSFDFKYLPKDQQVSLKICPNCHKPLPDPKAEYRRCPHCLFKLM